MRKIIEKAIGKGAERCEVYSLSSLNTEVEFEAGKLKNLSNTEETGYALRLVKDGRMGYATTTKADGLDRLVDDAIATSACGDAVEFKFAGAADVAGVKLVDERVKRLSIEEMMKRSEHAIAKLRDYEGEINAESGTTRRVQTVSVATSEGFEHSQERTLYQFYLAGSLVEGDNMLEAGGYYGGTAMDAGGSQLVDETIEDFANGRTNVGVSSGPTTVILTPRAVADVMLTLNYGVDGSMVERGISPLTGKLGETIFDERVSLYDDGLMESGYSSAAFDDEGVPMQRTTLVDGGVLKNFLTDLRTAAKLNLPATGNGLKLKRLIQTKDLGKMPASEITNWEMGGGDKPYAELLSGVSAGVIVDSIMGIMMGNLVAGDFSGNVALGFKVEGGKIVGRVKDTMIAGNVYKLLKDQLLDLSSDVTRVGLMGFIGSHRYPHLLLRDVSISSKG
ncbi:MAG: TldD/PmbA family protein [Candidatus Eisenbacteria bacterium]